MKKRTKITLRTKIYLTIVGLLALTGVFYAANPVPFTGGIPFPTGVAAAPDLFLVSEYCTDNIDTIDCQGNVSLFATIPGFGSCREQYMAMAPSQSAKAGFTPRDLFVTQGALVYKATPPGPLTLFATLPGCFATDHNGITFDHFGTFGFDMIVTCREGNVFTVHGDGTATQIATLFPPSGEHTVEGPAVVPPGFGPHGGEIWVADEVGQCCPRNQERWHRYSKSPLSRYRGSRPRYPEPSVHRLLELGLRPGGTTVVPLRLAISGERLHRVGWQRYPCE